MRTSILHAWMLAASLGLSAVLRGEEDPGYVSLFNGVDLSGWTALPGGSWQVKDGAIHGTSEAAEKRHGILLSDREYDDFEICFEYRILAGNSGFYFRAERVDHPVALAGLQAEIDARGNHAGGLYETLGRAWVVKPSASAPLFKPNTWNQMTVRAVDRQITVHLNGTNIAELQDDPGRLRGHFGLQLHGGQKMDVAFRNIRLVEIE